MPRKRDKRKITPLVVGISSSPRISGITETLLDAALEGAGSRGARAVKVRLNRMRYRPCQACLECHRTGRCVLKDDMRRIYRLLDGADAVILASPVYFGSVTAQLKAMIDRLHCLWWAGKRPGRTAGRGKVRRGYFICSAGSGDARHFAEARRMARIMFNTAGIKFSGSLLKGGIDGLKRKGASKKELKMASRMGEASAC